MADLIERDAVLNDLKESVKAAREWKEEAQDEEIKIRAEQAHGTFIECALRVKNAPAVNRWISVEDALPEIGYSVLVTRQTESNTRYIRIASRQDDCWMDNTDKYGKPNPHQVIAWMPMPDAYEPPESEVQEDDER